MRLDSLKPSAHMDFIGSSFSLNGLGRVSADPRRRQKGLRVLRIFKSLARRCLIDEACTSEYEKILSPPLQFSKRDATIFADGRNRR